MKPPTKAANTAATRVETVAMTEAKRVLRSTITSGANLEAAREEAAAILAMAFTLAEMVRAS